MNHNYAIQNQGRLAYSGILAAAVSPDIDIRKHNGFAFSFEVVAAIAADAVFEIQAAPADEADPCVPGDYAAIPEVVICEAPAVPAAASTVTIPAGTAVGTVCTGTIPCRPGAFVTVIPVSGTVASVRVVATLHGPR